MKTKIIASSLLALGMVASAIVPAFAQVGVGVSANLNTGVNTGVVNGTVNANANASAKTNAADRAANTQTKVDDRIQNMDDRGDAALTARVDSLNALSARINGMKNLSASEKATFSASLQGQITDLNNLEAKLKTDTSTTSLATDLKTIAPDFRIYILVRPQLSILAATDRVGTIVGLLQTIGTKIQARSSTADLTDFNAKIADANVQATAATNEVVSLQPDQGNATVQASNTAALKDARAKIGVANKDLQAAYTDAHTIIDGLKGTKATVSASSTTTVQ